jgi:phosphoserine phosphatase RsbU/P
MMAFPSAAGIIPAFLFLVAIIGVAVVAGRGPGLLAAAVSTVTLWAVIAVRPPVALTDQVPGWWAWIVVFGALCAAAVAWLDRLLTDAARRATAVFDPLVEGSPAGIAVLDRELRFVRVNPALAGMGGRPPGAYMGRTLAEIGPDPLAGLRDQLRALLTTGGSLHHHLVSVHASDQPDRQLLVDAFPVRLTGRSDGPVTGLGVVVADVTEQHRTARLEREAAQLRATAELSHRLLATHRLAGLAGFEYDAVNRQTTWSAEMCALLGRTEAPAPGDHDHIHPDDTDRLMACQQATLSTGASFTIEMRMVHTCGAVLEVLLHGEAVRVEGTVTGLWGVIQDVTAARAAQRAAFAAQQAMEETRRQAEAEHRLLTRFQEAMLPTELPDIPDGTGTTLAAAYIAVADRIDIGGDWYDAFALRDGRIVLVVGDVVGHDLEAAAIMSQVRAVTRCYAAENPDPGLVLTRLNRQLPLACPSDTLISAVAFRYDPVTGQLDWANAGHPYPLLADANGVVRTLETHDPILGLTSDTAYTTHHGYLPHHGTLVCYTDGLVECRAVDVMTGMERLRSHVAALLAHGEPGPTRDVLNHITAKMNADQPPEDDVCVLILQRDGKSS